MDRSVYFPLMPSEKPIRPNKVDNADDRMGAETTHSADGVSLCRWHMSERMLSHQLPTGGARWGSVLVSHFARQVSAFFEGR